MEHLYFAYPLDRSNVVLRAVNMDIAQGRTTVMMDIGGYLGGRCATIELIERLYDPVDGVLNFDGIDSREINVLHLRAQLGLVARQPFLFTYTIKDNITYGLFGATQEQTEQAALLAGAHDFIRALPQGYDSYANSDDVVLTTVQQQKICIARAIIRNPKILLVDSVTNVLEPADHEEILEVLDRARHGRTCFVVTQNFEDFRLADLIVIMRDGHIVESGTPERLLAQEDSVYSRLARQHNLH